MGRFERGESSAANRVTATMPKQKTHKATKKRFRLTAKGKVKHRQAGTSHLAVRKSHKRKRKLRGTTLVDRRDARRIDRLLPGKG